MVERELLAQCRRDLGLTQNEFARALGAGAARTVRMWESGDRGIPGPVWVALRYMLLETGRHADRARSIDAIVPPWENEKHHGKIMGKPR
jgi:transcriptional regulator with XRE-family HTH domain